MDMDPDGWRERSDLQVEHASAERKRRRNERAENEEAAGVAGAAPHAHQGHEQGSQRERDHQRGHNDKSDFHQASPLSALSPTVVASTPSRLRLRIATSTTPAPASKIASGPNQSSTVPGFSGGS